MNPAEAIKQLPKNVELKYLEILGRTIQTFIWAYDHSDGYPTHRIVARNLNQFKTGTENLKKNVRAGYLQINENDTIEQLRSAMDYPRAGATSKEFSLITKGNIQIFKA